MRDRMPARQWREERAWLGRCGHAWDQSALFPFSPQLPQLWGISVAIFRYKSSRRIRRAVSDRAIGWQLSRWSSTHYSGCSRPISHVARTSRGIRGGTQFKNRPG
jgi:hypothetical protein